MRRALRMFAVILAVATFIWWLAAGAHRGWTQTRVPVKTVDAVTGLEAIEYQSRLVPGIDLLAAAWLLAGGLAITSLLFQRKLNSTHHSS